MERRVHRLQRKRRQKRQLLLLFFSLIFLISSGFFLHSSWKLRQELKGLAALAQEARGIETVKGEETNLKSKAVGESSAPASQPAILSQYQKLAAQNTELAGWIKIGGTKIDYPVMLPAADPNYYLNHAFDGSASYSGVPFMGQGSTGSSDNIIIYGHHMRNGTMFSDLMKYKEKAFWRKHPVIHFDTLYEERNYEVIGAFYSKVYYADETGVFRYYSYGGNLGRAGFEEYISSVKQSALYDTGITAVYGDQIITLSTCSYHTENGRFVVVARRRT